MKKTPRETNPQPPHFPSGLTSADILLIQKQCELQSATSKEQVEGFAKAYNEAKNLVAKPEIFNLLQGKDIEHIVLRFGTLVEKRNSKGYRSTPVTFSNGTMALNPDVIERAMQNFSEAYAENRMDSIEAYTEFEKIHPFEDGNGRIGDLLFKMDVARKTGLWPEQLPPDVFGQK